MLLAQTEPTSPESDSTLASQEWPQESRFRNVLAPAATVRLNEMLLAQTEPTAVAAGFHRRLQEWPQESRFRNVSISRNVDTGKQDALQTGAAIVLQTGDVETLLAYYPPELAEQRAQEWSAWQDAFSGLTVTLDFQIAEDDRVLNCWTFSGVHSSEYLNVPPSGNRVEFTGLFTSRMQGGKIIEEMVRGRSLRYSATNHFCSSHAISKFSSPLQRDGVMAVPLNSQHALRQMSDAVPPSSRYAWT